MASANLFFLPVAQKLKALLDGGVRAKTMIIEGILSIQAGDNPRIVEEKLKTFLTPAERAEFSSEGGAGEAARRPRRSRRPQWPGRSESTSTPTSAGS